MKIDLDLFFQLQALYTDYALAVDSGHWDSWPNFSPTNANTNCSREKTMNVAFPCPRCRLKAKAC